MTIFTTLQSKPSTAYLVLLLGFLFSLLINVNFVSDRAVNSLTNVQNDHTQLQAQTTFNNIQAFIENRKKILAELAESTIVISSAMGIETASMNIKDFLNERQILGTKENIFITDFTGDVIYSTTETLFKRPTAFNKIMEQQAEMVLSINKDNHQTHYFSLSLPIKHNNHVEGVITLDLINYPIKSLLAELIKDRIYAVSIINNSNSHVIFETEPLTGFSLVANSIVLDTNITLNFFSSNSKLQQEKSEYVWQIGTTLTVTMLFSFLLLAFIIRALLITPLEKLAISEQRVKLNEERYLLAVQGSNDGIWDWDIKENKLFLSTRLLDMTGYSTELEKELLDKEKLFFKYIHPEDRALSSQAFINHVKHDIPLDFTFRMLVADESYLYFRVRGIAFKNVNGRAERMAGSLTDITELTEKRLALKKALMDAKTANLAKSDFLANMSHEIRTPMNGVLGTLQMLKRETLSPSSQDLVDLGLSSSNALLSIINDILDLSKIESNNISLEHIDTHVIKLFTTIHSELSLLAEEKGIQLYLNIQENMPAHWIVDPVRLRQIIVNLVSNAIKFTLTGSVSISLGNANNQFSFSVIDTGIGIPPEHIEKLFNRFEQADSTTTRKFGGTGLGLAISKQLVLLMKGNIEVISTPNNGSTFTVNLPLKESITIHHSNKTQIIAETDKQTLKVKAPNAEKLTILLAEDNKINQTIFKAVMADSKANITIANDGVEAIQATKTHLPDLIFMDIQMPNMDGIEACEIIKKISPNTPIVALTANVMTNDIEKYKRSGFDFYLSKPLKVNEIYKLVEELLS